MKVFIFGGHGKIALLLAQELVGKSVQVVSVIRNPEHEGDIIAVGAEPLVADLEQLDAAGIAALLTGADALVWSAGAGGGSPERTYAVDRDAAERSMDAAKIAGVARYVMVSYFGASTNHGVPEGDSFYAYAEAKAAADAYLRASELDWTILAPSALTNDNGSGNVDVHAIESGSVSRANVAFLAAAVLGDDATIGKTIRFNDGDEDVATALAGL